MKITALNLFVLRRTFASSHRVPNLIPPTSVRAMKRCVDAGLVLIDGAELALTADGKARVASLGGV
jgi:hypothetical protein